MATSAPFSIDASMTSAFQALGDVPLSMDIAESVDRNSYKAVVLGGGTGAPVSIRSLLSLGIDTSAVVAMADDGGSTGILREAADVTPPGDIRKCIAAFAEDPSDPLVKAFKYRIRIADNHALGNLFIAALEDSCGSFTRAIEICERMLGAKGHVYPSTLEHVTLSAVTKDGKLLDGQAVACHSQTALSHVFLNGPDSYITANKAAIRAILDADIVILGPGSLFTSIIPNLLVPGILESLKRTNATKVFVCSVADAQGETWGLSVREHVEALCEHGMEGLIDYVFVHSTGQLKSDSPANASFDSISGGLQKEDEGNAKRIPDGAKPLEGTMEDIEFIMSKGITPIIRDFADSDKPTWHSPEALRNAIVRVIHLSQTKAETS